MYGTTLLLLGGGGLSGKSFTDVNELIVSNDQKNIIRQAYMQMLRADQWRAEDEGKYMTL